MSETDDRVFGITGTIEGHAGGRITIDFPVVEGEPNVADVQALLVGLVQLLGDYGQVFTTGGLTATVQVEQGMKYGPIDGLHWRMMLDDAKRNRNSLKDPVEARAINDAALERYHNANAGKA